MFGTMGIGAAFINAAGRGGKKKPNFLTFICASADAVLYQVKCVGTIKVVSTKNGETVTQTYTDLSNTTLSVQSDANSVVKIIGDVTRIWVAFRQGSPVGNSDITSFDATNCKSITYINLSSTDITSLDISQCSALTIVDLSYCSQLESLDASTNTAATSISLSGCTKITTIKYPATNAGVSTALASAITNATASDGTLYTDSQGAYYSTLETAAQGAGWTIAPLPA